MNFKVLYKLHCTVNLSKEDQSSIATNAFLHLVLPPICLSWPHSAIGTHKICAKFTKYFTSEYWTLFVSENNGGTCLLFALLTRALHAQSNSSCDLNFYPNYNPFFHRQTLSQSYVIKQGIRGCFRTIKFVRSKLTMIQHEKTKK